MNEGSGLSGGWREYTEKAKAEGPPNVTLAWLLHPIRWTKWRNEVRKQGPYAPEFNDFRRKRHEGPGHALSGEAEPTWAKDRRRPPSE